MTEQPITAAADMINQLTRPYATTEHITRDDGTTELHTVLHPSLLAQIGHATNGSSNLSDNDAGAHEFGSKPPTHLEAINLLRRISKQSAQLATDLGIPNDMPLTKRLSAIAGKLGIEPNRTVRSWWAGARLLTHWDAPAYRPHGVPCPRCLETGTLRIRFDDELATCTGCGESWDRTGQPEHGSLDILGQHVRWCADHDITKPRHWKIDANGYPVECTECLAEREALAAHQTAATKGEAKRGA